MQITDWLFVEVALRNQKSDFDHPSVIELPLRLLALTPEQVVATIHWSWKKKKYFYTYRKKIYG
jgi:hypothetical protein